MPERSNIHFPADRYFDPDPRQKEIAQQLYTIAAGLPLICPHGHVDARLFAEPSFSFGTPTELVIIPDHYIVRMLYSQGIPMESLGVPRQDNGPVEKDHRKIWQTFADHFYLFRGTPSGMWINYELREVFGIEEKLSSTSANNIYDRMVSRLQQPDMRPHALYERFKIEALCTTDAATDSLSAHHAITESGWAGRIVPTFRPDAVINLDTPSWRNNIQKLGMAAGFDVNSYSSFIKALEERRTVFKKAGATATDHAATTAFTDELSLREAEAIFQRALNNENRTEDVVRFTGHMLIESARMSVDDGLVMQLHTGVYRNHNRSIYERFGPDKGADIPVHGEFSRNLSALLSKFGNHPGFSLILFTVDESTYARELAPLAGHYPALKLGPPWWFLDSLNGMRRYFDLVIETAGLYNTVGFNDDTRAFLSIPARHDLWRRAAANWIAGLVVRGIVDMDDAQEMICDCSYNLAKKAYKLG